MRVGFIGLGTMGLPMARNLVRAGHEVLGFNRSAVRVEQLVAEGGKPAESIEACVSAVDAVITMLPDSPDVKAVYLGDGGVTESARPSTLLIDMSTIRADTAVEIHAAAAVASMPMLDAPVSGGEKGARDAQLSIMCGGSEDAFALAVPLLGALGTTIVRVGAAGAGQIVKAANQLIVAGIIELVAEALVFLDSHDVELDSALEVINGGLAGNTVITRKGDQLIRGDFQPGFRVELHDKDLSIYLAAAHEHEVFTPVGALMGELMRTLKSTGGGRLDHGALLAQVDELSGRSRWVRR